MELDPVINTIAGRADDFLAGVASRREARAGIAELIAADYPQLPPGDRQRVTDSVMAILEAEDFFTVDPERNEPGIEGASETE